MANIYVRSTTGNNANSGADWANAKATIGGATAIDANGDTIYVSQAHVETYSANTDIGSNIAGTPASPVRVLCVDDSSTPPVAMANTALIETTTGTLNFGPFGGSSYWNGIKVKAAAGITLANSLYAVFENATLEANGSPSLTGNSSGRSLRLVNTNFKFTNTTSAFDTRNSFTAIGGSFETGSTNLRLCTGAGTNQEIVFNGADFRNCVTGLDISNCTGANSKITLVNCALPSGWTGSPHTSTPAAGTRISLYNCDSADTNYRLWIAAYGGTIRSETVVVRTGGASDGTTPISWKMASNANASELLTSLATDPIAIWNDTTGSSKTVTVEIITDNVTLTDAECWVEVEYLGTSGLPLGALVTDKRATPLTTPANQTTSTETWTTTGLGTPVKQKLSVTFTPQEKGFIYATVRLAKASTTVYVDPKITVT